MTSRQWAEKAWTIAGYHFHQIAKRCGVAVSTVRCWKHKDSWGAKATKVTSEARESVELLAHTVDWTIAEYPQGARPGAQLARLHGLRSKLFEGFSTNAKNVIFDTLNTTERDELKDLEAVSAISLGLIAQWNGEIKRLEQQAQEVADNLDSGTILNAVTIIHEESEGIRAGKDERLKTAKTERQYIRVNEAIAKLQAAISRETANFGKSQDRIARIKNDRAKLQLDRAGDNSATSHLVITLKNDAQSADLEDD